MREHTQKNHHIYRVYEFFLVRLYKFNKLIFLKAQKNTTRKNFTHTEKEGVREEIDRDRYRKEDK